MTGTVARPLPLDSWNWNLSSASLTGCFANTFEKVLENAASAAFDLEIGTKESRVYK
jgi:hypothetical protein